VQVTLSLAVFRRFPWKKVPIYLLAQLLGGWMGGLIVYANYFHAIKIVDPDLTRATASLFATYALDYLPGGTYVPLLHTIKLALRPILLCPSPDPTSPQLLAFFRNSLGRLFCLLACLRPLTNRMAHHLLDWSLLCSSLSFSAKVLRSECRQPLR